MPDPVAILPQATTKVARERRGHHHGEIALNEVLHTPNSLFNSCRIVGTNRQGSIRATPGD
jgi:hypothetical protein